MEKLKPYTHFSCSLYFAIGAFTRAIENLATECWRDTGLSAGEASLMTHLFSGAAASPVRISEELRVNPSSVTRLADKLEEKGLIKRVQEGLMVRLEVTAKGKQLAPALMRGERELLQQCERLFGATRARSMTASLYRHADVIGEYLEGEKISRPV